MPEISRFSEMIIYMRYNDDEQHHRPHIHVFCGGDKASVAFDGEILAGRLPKQKWRILNGWLALHEDELYAMWNKAVSGQTIGKIPPIK